MHDDLSNLILECIKKYKHAEIAVSAFETCSQVRYSERTVTNFEHFLFCILRGVTFSESDSLDAQRQIILSGMKEVYDSICDCYLRSAQAAQSRFLDLANEYEAVVIPQIGRLAEANDNFNLAASRDRLDRTMDRIRAFNRRPVVDEAFVRTSWDGHFEVFENSYKSISEMNSTMKSTIEKVSKVLREEERVQLSRDSLAATKTANRRWKWGFFVALLGLVGFVFVNFFM